MNFHFNKTHILLKNRELFNIGDGICCNTWGNKVAVFVLIIPREIIVKDAPPVITVMH